MSTQEMSKIPEVLRRYERELLADWLEQMFNAAGRRRDLMKDGRLQEQSREFLSLLCGSAQRGNLADTNATSWTEIRDFLATISRSRAQQGFSSSETATFVFSLKQPLFLRLRQEHAGDADELAADLWLATTLVDNLGLYITELYQKSREEIISRQQQELLELSTPVVELWQGILALPLIGTLDSARTQVVMESLLLRIVQTGSEIAIIDITSVPTVDTLVAQHLLKTVAAARLMGADCIISAIRPQIAQTIVHLGVDLTNIVTSKSGGCWANLGRIAAGPRDNVLLYSANRTP
jgi:rsbT co-antagonist protein RsbR